MGFIGSDSHWHCMPTLERVAYLNTLGITKLQMEIDDLRFNDNKIQRKADNLFARLDSAIRWITDCAYPETMDRRLTSERVCKLKKQTRSFILLNRKKSKYYDMHDKGLIAKHFLDHE